MDIKLNLNPYVKASEFNSQSIKDNGKIKANGKLEKKQDVVSISPEAASFGEITRSTKAIASDIDNSISQEKINSLKAQCAEGTYNVSTDDLVDAMLGRFSF